MKPKTPNNMTNNEAIDYIKKNFPPENYSGLREALTMAITALNAENKSNVYAVALQVWDEFIHLKRTENDFSMWCKTMANCRSDGL